LQNSANQPSPQAFCAVQHLYKVKRLQSDRD
jgi:hypothetical protein